MSTLLDAVLPEYQFSERHSIRVDASPEVALAAAKEVSLGEMPLARLLFRIRGMRIPARGRLWEQMLAGGFVDLGEVPGREVAGGVIGQMWRLSGGDSPRIANQAEFSAFNKPGYAKGAMSFMAQPVDGRSQLLTETRVFATDAAARRAFTLYWLAIRPGSGIIRGVWLRAAKRRAERR